MGIGYSPLPIFHYCFIKYLTGTSLVSHTPFLDKKNLYPSLCISPALTIYNTGLPWRWPTFTAVSSSFDKCTYNLLLGISPCTSIELTYFSPVPCHNSSGGSVSSSSTSTGIECPWLALISVLSSLNGYLGRDYQS